MSARGDILGLDIAYAYYGFMNRPDLLVQSAHTHSRKWFYRWKFSFLGREWDVRNCDDRLGAILACSTWSLRFQVTEAGCFVTGLRGDPNEIYTDLAALRLAFPSMVEYGYDD